MQQSLVRQQGREDLGRYDEAFLGVYRRWVRKALYAGMLLLQVSYFYVTPPERYPYIRELCFALLGFAYFALIYLYVHCKMVYEFKVEMEKRNT